MEMAVNENSEHSFDYGQDNMVPEVGNHGGSEPKDEFSVEEIRSVLEVIASTGKFWSVQQSAQNIYKLKNRECENEMQLYM
ncbi:hypothetical protein ACOSQ2_002963 [Xanthoceras sorbifolium]